MTNIDRTRALHRRPLQGAGPPPAEATTALRVVPEPPREPAPPPTPGPDPAGTTVLLLSPEEAAAALGIGRTKVYDLVARGYLEAVHIGRSCRIPRDALQDYVARLRAQSQQVRASI